MFHPNIIYVQILLWFIDRKMEDMLYADPEEIQDFGIPFRKSMIRAFQTYIRRHRNLDRLFKFIKKHENCQLWDCNILSDITTKLIVKFNAEHLCTEKIQDFYWMPFRKNVIRTPLFFLHLKKQSENRNECISE